MSDIEWGSENWGTDSWGGVEFEAYDFPAIIEVEETLTTSIPREWPFMASMSGSPWPDSIDPFVLLLHYGDEALLYIAVLMSLFTDARASSDANLPVPDGDRRGWWADRYLIHTMFKNNLRPKGSLLWLLSRSKMESDSHAIIEQYSKDALKWMVESKLAKEINIDAAKGYNQTIAVSVEVIHSKGSILLQHSDFWKVFNAYH